MDILITDRRLQLSRSIAEMFKNAGNQLCITTDEITSGHSAFIQILWNRKSPFSLQSIPLQCKNADLSLEMAILVFDGLAYADLYRQSDIHGIHAICTDLITAYMDLTYTFCHLFIKQKRGKLIFINRTISPNEHHPALAGACGAFSKMAEESAYIISSEENPYLEASLLHLDTPDDESAVEWLQAHAFESSRYTGKWTSIGRRGLFK